MRQFIIDTFRYSDKAQVAHLHKEAIPLGFLSSLGMPFLGELYSAIALAPNSGVWVARSISGEDVLGFIAGTANLRNCYQFVLKHRAVRLLIAALTHLWSPVVIRRAVETLIYPNKIAQESVHRSSAELLAIAVDKNERGKGIGKALIATLESAFQTWDLYEKYAVITYAGDPKANEFYQRVGFTLIREFRHHQHQMCEYQKFIPHEKSG